MMFDDVIALSEVSLTPGTSDLFDVQKNAPADFITNRSRNYEYDSYAMIEVTKSKFSLIISQRKA